MQLFEYLNADEFHRNRDAGLIHISLHRAFPLALASYSRKAVLENVWNDTTECCRGLIWNTTTGEIVARPFEKFFDLGTAGRPETFDLPETGFTVTDKINGSLGILYRYQGIDCIASKGSFHSPHAEWATAWYRSNFERPLWPAGHTPVFEMICEHIQSHAVHYGENRLVLLALINNETGEEVSYDSLGYWAAYNHLSVPHQYHKSLEEIAQENRENKEGYVVSWPRPGHPPLRVKVKHPAFLRLRKLINRATPKLIAEVLAKGDTNMLEAWLKHSTIEFAAWVEEWQYKLERAYRSIFALSAFMVKDALRACTTRKEFAMYFKIHIPQYTDVCFAMLDEKDYKQVIWKHVAPMVKDAKPFTTEE